LLGSFSRTCRLETEFNGERTPSPRKPGPDGALGRLELTRDLGDAQPYDVMQHKCALLVRRQATERLDDVEMADAWRR
jgi:hypothetical protein